jgi:hypothetical protein
LHRPRTPAGSPSPSEPTDGRPGETAEHASRKHARLSRERRRLVNSTGAMPFVDGSFDEWMPDGDRQLEWSQRSRVQLARLTRGRRPAMFPSQASAGSRGSARWTAALPPPRAFGHAETTGTPPHRLHLLRLPRDSLDLRERTKNHRHSRDASGTLVLMTGSQVKTL